MGLLTGDGIERPLQGAMQANDECLDEIVAGRLLAQPPHKLHDIQRRRRRKRLMSVARPISHPHGFAGLKSVPISFFISSYYLYLWI